MRQEYRLFASIIAVAWLWTLAAGCRSSSEPTTSPVTHERAIVREKPSTAAATQSPSSAPSTGVVWKSVREHSGIGRLAIVLNPPGETRIISESREGGISELEIDFASPVKLVKPEAIRAETKGASVAPATARLASPTQLLVQFAGLKEGCYRFSLAGAVEGVDGATGCKARVLEGDINSDGHISLTDTMYINSRIGQPVTAQNAALDVDVNGKIETNDMQRVKAAIRKTVACD